MTTRVFRLMFYAVLECAECVRCIVMHYNEREGMGASFGTQRKSPHTWFWCVLDLND